MRHIRRSDASVKDRRFRHRVYSNKNRPTFCGAEPTDGDFSRGDGRRLIENGILRPDWLVDLCPECRHQVREETR